MFQVVDFNALHLNLPLCCEVFRKELREMRFNILQLLLAEIERVESLVRQKFQKFEVVFNFVQSFAHCLFCLVLLFLWLSAVHRFQF